MMKPSTRFAILRGIHFILLTGLGGVIMWLLLNAPALFHYFHTPR